jgi:alpha-amylase
VFVLKRTKGDKTLLYLANFSDTTSQVKVTEKGVFRDLISKEKINLNGEALQVAPLTFKIIIN